MAINLDFVGKKFEPVTFEYEEKDCILYGLGIGAGLDELDFLIEDPQMKVFPTFGVIPAFPVATRVVIEMQLNPVMLVHGEQKLVLHKPIKPQGKILTGAAVSGIYDKGSGALVVVETDSRNESGDLIFENTFSFFVRGEGGFGGDRGPKTPKIEPPEGKEPDCKVETTTQPNQALLYRLSGDLNPLHAKPDFAKMAGFDRPILHGLCTYGYVGRAILDEACGGDPAKLKSFPARFSGVVFPGDTIITEGWKTDKNKLIVTAKTQTGTLVISNCVVELAG